MHAPARSPRSGASRCAADPKRPGMTRCRVYPTTGASRRCAGPDSQVGLRWPSSGPSWALWPPGWGGHPGDNRDPGSRVVQSAPALWPPISALTFLRTAGSGGEVIGPARRQARPLRDRPAVWSTDGAAVLVGAHLLAARAEVPPRPALWGVLPGFLAPVDGQVEHRVRAAH